MAIRKQSSGPDGVQPPNSSGITVIIVGLGYAGSVAAVECHRKGHRVIVFEQAKEIKALGDVIGITGNAANIISKWGNGKVHERLLPILCDYARMNIYTHKGEYLTGHSMLGYSAGSGYAANRGDLQVIFYEHIKELGIDVRLGKRVEKYFENDSEAGVIVDGKRITADCVLACDGVHAMSRSFIIGRSDKPFATGYAVFRAWFDATEARKDPDLAWAFKGNRDKMETFIGPDVHCIVGTGRRTRDIVWTCTHKDIWDIEESWSYPGKIVDALKVVEGWDKRVIDIIKKTPEHQLVDYKLLWREPLPGWTSKHGRMILLGDSAHPFLPTSGQGAGQAVEDAGTIAICLELGGKKDVPLAIRTCEKIRYARATLAQKIGIETRDAWHNFNVEEFKKNPKSIEMPRPEWLFGHDPQVYAYEEYETAARAVKTKSPYTPRNVPPPGENHRTGDFTGKKMQAWIKHNTGDDVKDALVTESLAQLSLGVDPEPPLRAKL